MAKARSTFVVVLLFVWTAAPALRCLIPGEVLSAEEQACCTNPWVGNATIRRNQITLAASVRPPLRNLH